MRHIFLVALALTAATLDARAVSPSGHFQSRLLQLQRQGPCSELPQFGVNTHRRRNPDDINVSLVSRTGARIVRLEIPWIDLERQRQFDFGRQDYLIEKLRALGKSIVFGLAYGHPDYSDGRAKNGYPLPPSTAEQRAAFGRYARAIAERYRGPDIVYEIWNEPNLALFWPPAINAPEYGRLLVEATRAIRGIEPNARIISGGLANENDPAGFLRSLASSGALAGIDGIAFHPYRQDAPENSLYDIDEFEKAAAGHDLPLWITEWGYSEVWLAKKNPDRVRDRSAIMTARLMLTAALARAKAALVYDLIDDGTNPNDQESNFGLYDYEFRPKPAADAFKIIASLMSACSRYEFKVDAQADTVTAVFHADSTTSYAIWTYGAGRPRAICFVAPGARPAHLVDVSGKRLALEPCGAAQGVGLTISETSGPLILQGKNTSSK